MAGFVKIYGSKLITSSLWDEEPEARLVFLSLLAIAEADGFVDVPNERALARVLNLTVPYLEKALRILTAPDQGSRSPDYEGRRVIRDGSGWRCVNYAQYREFRSAAQESTRQRVERHRSRDTVTCNASNADPVTGNNVTLEAEIRDQRSEAERAPSALTGHDLCVWFGEVRADQVTGALPWVSVRSPEKAAKMAEAIGNDAAARADVKPTMALLFKNAKAAKYSRSPEIMTDPSFAFGCWCSKWTELREELHGKSPKAEPFKPRLFAKVGT